MTILNVIQAACLTVDAEPHAEAFDNMVDAGHDTLVTMLDTNFAGLATLRQIEEGLTSLDLDVNRFSGRPLQPGAAALFAEEYNQILAPVLIDLQLGLEANPTTKQNATSMTAKALASVRKLIDKVIGLIMNGMARLFNTNVRVANAISKEAHEVEKRVSAMPANLIIPRVEVFKGKGSTENEALLTSRTGMFDSTYLEGYTAWYQRQMTVGEMVDMTNQLTAQYDDVAQGKSAVGTLEQLLLAYRARLVITMSVGGPAPVGSSVLSRWEEFAPGGGYYGLRLNSDSIIPALERQRGRTSHNGISSVSESLVPQMARALAADADFVVESHKKVHLIERSLKSLSEAAKAAAPKIAEANAIPERYAEAAIRLADNLRQRVRMETEYLTIMRLRGQLLVKSVALATAS